MLAQGNRLRVGADFRLVVRRGRRSGNALLVAHLLSPVADGSDQVPARVGFVVSKAVGPAVTRNLVKRRLRHLMRERIDSLPGGSMLVLRALPASGVASYRDLSSDLDRCLGRV